MSTTDVDTLGGSAVTRMHADLKLEVVVLPVSDVDRSKTYYASLGWRLDADFAFDNGFRVVQFTPPGSGTSVQFGTKISTAAPGSAQGLYLVVSDVSAARDELAGCGADISEVFHPSTPGGQFEPLGGDSRAAGMDEHHASYGSFATLHDPDGNTWLLQEVTSRLPGRIADDATSYESVADLAGAMRRASVAHGRHEARIGTADENWPDWYATYMVAEQAGSQLPE
jgi:catechol 2,3-dioxygenase-like lactoylglutathione lyase family enzyme